MKLRRPRRRWQVLLSLDPPSRLRPSELILTGPEIPGRHRRAVDGRLHPAPVRQRGKGRRRRRRGTRRLPANSRTGAGSRVQRPVVTFGQQNGRGRLRCATVANLGSSHANRLAADAPDADGPLRVLVYPHDLGMGGSQLNAIDLAGAVRDRGHDVTVVGPDGLLVDRVHRLGLSYTELPPPRLSTTGTTLSRLRSIVKSEKPDVVHAYEGVPASQCWYGLHLPLGTPVLATVNSMSVPSSLPRDMPLLVCTPNIASANTHRRQVDLLEIPVDVADPTLAAGADDFLRSYGLRPDELHVVIVGRVAPELKLQGLLEACAAMGRVARRVPARLVIVGDGPSMPLLRAAAATAGDVDGRPAVVLTGQLNDPRPAYAAADVFLGMGGSALRAMAAGRPVVVQGEGGFWGEVTPETLPLFRNQGYYGIGSEANGTERIEAILMQLLSDPVRRDEIAALGLEIARTHHALTVLAEQLEGHYRLVSDTSRSWGEFVRAAPATMRSLGYVLHRKSTVRRGAATDEFNSRKRIEEGILASQSRLWPGPTVSLGDKV